MNTTGATLEILLHGIIMRLPFASAAEAKDAMGVLRPLIGQAHSFKNGDRELVVTIMSLEGPSDIVVDHVQAICLMDNALAAQNKAQALITEGTAIAKMFGERADETKRHRCPSPSHAA
jgi:hypothetical protein